MRLLYNCLLVAFLIVPNGIKHSPCILQSIVWKKPWSSTNITSVASSVLFILSSSGNSITSSLFTTGGRGFASFPLMIDASFPKISCASFTSSKFTGQFFIKFCLNTLLRSLRLGADKSCISFLARFALRTSLGVYPSLKVWTTACSSLHSSSLPSLELSP